MKNDLYDNVLGHVLQLLLLFVIVSLFLCVLFCFSLMVAWMADVTELVGPQHSLRKLWKTWEKNRPNMPPLYEGWEKTQIQNLIPQNTNTSVTTTTTLPARDTQTKQPLSFSSSISDGEI